MPKTKRSQREPKPKPYTKPGKKAIVTKKDALRQPFRFLELPSEIRMRIYDLFCTMPLTDRDSTPPERSWIVKARGNLLLTCRQIHEEFASNLYRSADIIIASAWASGEIKHPSVASYSKPVADFERLFLRTLATYKLQFIRRLELDASFGPQPVFFWAVASANYGMIRSLAMVLSKHIHNLKSLCEVSFIEMTQLKGQSRSTYLPPILNSDPQTRDRDFWETNHEVPEWDCMATQYLQTGRRSGFLRSWTLTKTAWIQTHASQALAEQLGCQCVVERTGITFRKTESTNPTLPANQVIPRLIIEWEAV
jgi:hypothetical protein